MPLIAKRVKGHEADFALFLDLRRLDELLYALWAKSVFSTQHHRTWLANLKITRVVIIARKTLL